MSREKERKEETKSKENNDQDSLESTSKTPRYIKKNHSEEKIFRDKRKGVITRSKAAQEQVFMCLLCETKPKTVEEAFKDKNWMKAMK